MYIPVRERKSSPVEIFTDLRYRDNGGTSDDNDRCNDDKKAHILKNTLQLRQSEINTIVLLAFRR